MVEFAIKFAAAACYRETNPCIVAAASGFSLQQACPNIFGPPVQKIWSTESSSLIYINRITLFSITRLITTTLFSITRLITIGSDLKNSLLNNFWYIYKICSERQLYWVCTEDLVSAIYIAWHILLVLATTNFLGLIQA